MKQAARTRNGGMSMESGLMSTNATNVVMNRWLGKNAVQHETATETRSAGQRGGTMEITSFTDLQGRRRVEVYRWHGQRRPACVKKLRLLWSETTGGGSRRDMFEGGAHDNAGGGRE